MPLGYGGEFLSGYMDTSAIGAPGSVSIIDLGLINLVTATMDGPQTLYTIPAGSYLASIRFTDDPNTVVLDHFPGHISPFYANTPALAIGTVKSFGWQGFGWATYPPGLNQSGDSYFLAPSDIGYGPFAALDTGVSDFGSLVLSASSVGPIQIGMLLSTGLCAGVRVASIAAWVADTTYQSPASNTVATPGVLQKCAILANGTIWFNGGTTGTSGATSPNFAANAGGSVSDGADIVCYDTSSAAPTTGKIHAVAEIWTPTAA